MYNIFNICYNTFSCFKYLKSSEHIYEKCHFLFPFIFLTNSMQFSKHKIRRKPASGSGGYFHQSRTKVNSFFLSVLHAR